MNERKTIRKKFLMVLLGSTMLMTSNVFAQESINITENDNIKIIEENIDPYEKVIEDLTNFSKNSPAS